MDLEILMIGKVKSPPVAGLLEEYTNRIRRFCPCRVRGLRESRYSDEVKDGAKIIEEEGERILAALAPGAMCVALDAGGQSMDSLRFSRFLEERLFRERRRVVFVVGGYLGLSSRVKEQAAMMLSLSKMTLPHEMAALVLTEQLYRAFTIMKHLPYHK